MKLFPHIYSFKCYIALSVLLLTSLTSGEARPYWKAASYFGNVIFENSVGAVIFDPGIGGPNPECYNTTGTVKIFLMSCPFDALSYFTVTPNNTVTLAKPYSLVRYSPFVPDCTIGCSDASDLTVVVGLTIQLVGANTRSPVWSTLFPTVFTLTSLDPLQFLVNTEATDDDIDKTTSGRVTYIVSTVDGEPGSASSYLAYEMGGNSSKLGLFNSPPWRAGSSHLVLIKAQDNPVNGTPNVITKLLSIVAGSNTSTYSQPSTTPTTTTTSSSTESSILSSPISDEQIANSTTSTPSNSSSVCTGSAITCNENWIYIILGVGLLLLLGGIAAVLATYFTEKSSKISKTTVEPVDDIKATQQQQMASQNRLNTGIRRQQPAVTNNSNIGFGLSRFNI